MSEISIIELWPHWTECTICGKDTPLKYFVPMYEGKRVDTTKSDEWAGMPVCKECYNKDDTVRGSAFAPLPPLSRSSSAESGEWRAAIKTRQFDSAIGTLDTLQSSTFDESRGDKLRSPLETAGSPLRTGE